MLSLSFEPALGLLDTERNTGQTEKELARSRPRTVFGVAVDYDVRPTLQSSFDCKKPVMNLVLISTLYHQYIFILFFNDFYDYFYYSFLPTSCTTSRRLIGGLQQVVQQIAD